MGNIYLQKRGIYAVPPELLTLCAALPVYVMAVWLWGSDYLLPDDPGLIDWFAEKGGENDILLSIPGVREGCLHTSFTEMQNQFRTIERD